MNRIIFFIAFTAAWFTLSGQNMLRNGSFENGNCIPDNYYGPSTSKGIYFNTCLTDWEHCGTDKFEETGHSPDWFASGALSKNAFSGRNFVHMVNYEAIQQKLNAELVQYNYYWISVWVNLNSIRGGQPQDFSTAALNIYAGGSGVTGKKRFQYEVDPDGGSNFNACDASYRNLEANNKSLIKQIDLSNYPIDEWIQIQFIYQYHGLVKRDIIAFELIDTYADNRAIGCQR